MRGCSKYILINSSRISTPRTKHSKDPVYTVPLYGLERIKEVITEGFPELIEFRFTDSRVFIHII
jgi:sarcosine oxidase/L-pipecolate oxidase